MSHLLQTRAESNPVERHRVLEKEARTGRIDNGTWNLIESKKHDDRKKMANGLRLFFAAADYGMYFV